MIDFIIPGGTSSPEAGNATEPEVIDIVGKRRDLGSIKRMLRACPSSSASSHKRRVDALMIQIEMKL